MVDSGTVYRSVWITCSSGVGATTGRNVSSPMARSTGATVAPAAVHAPSSSEVKCRPAVGAALDRSPSRRGAQYTV